MKRSLKKGLAMLLTLSMVLSLTSNLAFAAGEDQEVDAGAEVVADEPAAEEQAEEPAEEEAAEEPAAEEEIAVIDEEIEEEEEEDLPAYADYEPGVTVVEDETSPTGYNVVFIFDESSVNPEDYGLIDVAKVQVYSDGMFLFNYQEQPAGAYLDPKNAHTPHEFVEGMYPAGGDTDSSLNAGKIAYYEDMVEFEDGMWGAVIPLTSGATYYNYRLTDSEGTVDNKYIDDPANPTMTNEASDAKSRSSMVYVPYSEKMGKVDRSVENPREDGKTGTVEFVSYEGTRGSDRYLAVYLPYGYDADREEPYNVLYMSHGWQSEPLGSELRWMNECAVPNIMDNLEGDFIVVTMNNQDYYFMYNYAWPELQAVVGYMEENYNVGTEPANRALAGLSYGGYLTSQIYVNNPSYFDYYGIWSYANNGALNGLDDAGKAALASEHVNLSIGSGDWDYMLPQTDAFAAGLDELGVEYDVMSVPGSHDWRTWQAMFAVAVEDFFFKGIDYTAYEPGVTVEEDENSPTGYTATFIYKEQESYNGLAEDIVKVGLYSDTFWLFDPNGDMPLGVTPTRADGVAPDQFKPGLVPAGGDGKNRYDGVMKEFAPGLWALQVPLTSGAFPYNFEVTDANGKTLSRLDDPSNPKMKNEATGISSYSSMVYVPYNAKTMGKGEWADRSVELPIADESKKGTVETVSYTGGAGDTRGLAVYLPAGYDADRAEPYKVLYLSHGLSSDQYGNELRWMSEGAVPNIMDNLIADGKAEPFVVVTMNNMDYKFFNSTFTLWDPAKLWVEQELIMDFIEENYNVCDTAEGRAYAGLSMGGYTSSSFYLNHAEEFSYFGIWSYANTGDIAAQAEYLQGLDKQPEIMLAAGMWDYLRSPVISFGEKLAELGINSEYYEVPAAHDWKNWHLTYAYAVENFFWKGVDYSKYEPGVTVEEDENSPTGYTATFVYKEQDSYSKTPGDIVKVELYSDIFWLFDPNGDMPLGVTPVRENGVAPDQFKPGLVPAGGDGAKNGYYGQMSKIGDGLWGLQVPLTSGAFPYNFQVYDAEGNMTGRLDDPSNPKMYNEATGIGSYSSMVYIPYNAKTMGTGEWADRSVELPMADESKKGTVETVSYTGGAGDKRGLAVYLPAGYDADREEPYKVLYLSHGLSSDQYGNELRWMSEGAVPNIMDNLIADGKAEPFVVVTMNNMDYKFFNSTFSLWDPAKLWVEQELIMAFIEENYNVCDTAEGRAYAGLSMGGYTSSSFYLNHAEEFSYFGIWSYANTGDIAAQAEYLQGLEKQPYLMLGAGMWDYLRAPVISFGEQLKDLGIYSSYYEVPAAHDWKNWHLVYAYAVENFFWKGVDFTEYEPGVTVEADENSPTGYTATFIYEELDSYNGLADDIVKVELYSDCFWHFDPNGNLTLGKTPTRADGVAPEEYVPGLVPAGGSGGTNGYYADMYEFAPGMWALQVPLSSGAFVYNFQVTDENGKLLSRLDDPNNPKMYNTATGIGSVSSLVYIPYNKDTMGTGKWIDRSVEMPIADESKKGTVDTVAYTGAAGDTRGLAVYLPAGYDAERVEPYKVLYLSHGASSDQKGNELRWMNEGAVPNIMDNLIAAGKAEPFVVVTMNNQDLSNFNYAKVWAEQELIMDYIEENYNVFDTAGGRAFAGLSMGGLTTSRMYLNHGDEFSYYGIWSYAQANISGYEDYLKNLEGEQYLMFGAGMWDYLRSQVVGMRDNLQKIGIGSEYVEVPGAHDWETWQLLYAYAVENFFWKGEQGGSGGSGGGGGSVAPAVPSTPAEKDCVAENFSDLDVNAWYHDAVDYVLTNGIMAGVAEGKFAPGMALTRGMVVQMLWAMEGKPVSDGALSFTDVAADAWYAEAVRWAAAEGIVSGYSAEKFGPDDAVTREQMAVMLYGYARYKGADLSVGENTNILSYTDAFSISDWAFAGLQWACGEGILSGKTGGYLDPTGTATRMEAAQMLMKFGAVLAG